MADTKKPFAEDWATNTMTGRAVDTLTGGAVSGASKRLAKSQNVNREGKGDKESGPRLSNMRDVYKDRYK